MTLPPDIAYRVLNRDAVQAAAWEDLLSPQERAHLQSFLLDRRQQEFILGRVAARTLLAEQMGVAPAEVPLQVKPSGAVEVAGGAHRLSIAHAGGCAVAAVARRPMGVDLEQIMPRHPDLYRFMLHPDEYPLFEQLPLDPVRAPILCWTLKEATLKALHTGLRLSPKKLRLQIDLQAQAALVQVEEGGWWQLRFEEREGFYLAIAYAGEGPAG